MAHKHHHHDKEDEEQEYLVRRTLAPPSSDMNVTPLIDVLLVLLVIFMATLPMTQKGVDVDLPLETSATTKPPDTTQVVIEIAADRRLSINKEVVTFETLDATLHRIFDPRTDKTLFVVGDGSLRYGDVVAIIDAGHALALRVAIVTAGMKMEALSKKGG